MDNNYYSIYLESVFQLANTLKIKFEYNIKSINDILTYTHPNSFDINNPRTWKYYLNVSGHYHSTDTPMIVTSLDTLEDIVFNKNNLIDHRATARAYQYGTRYYHELVSKYPTQETLIQGILYPVNIDKAISAKEGEILGYPGHLIEINEYSLIRKLQEWIDGFISRWVNPHFALSHDLYYFTIYSVFYSLIPQTILRIRHEACLSNEAHSFHVKQFLASHGKLDKFYDQMTLKQSLWLYRNINYVKKNLGASKTFETITEHIMTERKIPLSGYTAFHNVENMPDEIYPETLFRKETLNAIEAVESTNPLTLSKMLIKEDKLARLNYDVRVNDSLDIEESFENSISNKMLTKALESTLFDYTGSSPYSLENILLNHWIYLSSLDIYKAFIQLENPRSGEIFNLSAKDTFVLAYYLFCKSFNLELLEVPIVPAIRVQRIPLVTIDEIYSIVDHSLIPRQLAADMLSIQPLIDPIISTDSFYELCDKIYRAANYQHGLIAYQEHYYRRGLAHGMASRIYCDYICRFDEEHKSYQDWFNEHNINISDYDFVNYKDEWLKLLHRATGVDVRTTNSLASIQQAMTNIMVTLSSYSVQYINETNTSAIRLLENPTVRPGDVNFKLKQELNVDHMVVGTLKHKGKYKDFQMVDLGGCGFREKIKSMIFGRYDFEITVKPLLPQKASRRYYRVRIGGIGANVLNIVAPNDEGVIPVPGVDLYLSQSDEERMHVVDLYDPCYLNQQNKRQ